ncbi:substrate-binding periplasmic protein [Chitinimonas sp.]|uniref:substrate-binding periplasmic protein n=1 Tax=Chitinimonas sp. TaxID=1934313 RepID=UPI0035B3F3C5
MRQLSNLLRLVLLALPMLVKADEPIRQKLTCYNDVLEPYFIRDGDRFIGLNADVMVEAAKRIGIALELREMPWKRLEEEIKRGSASLVECAFAFSRMPAREAYMEYTNVVMQKAQYVLFIRNESSYRSLDDLNGKVIGIHRGFRLPDAVKDGAAAGRFTLEEVATDRTNFLKLAAGRIDAVMINYDVGMYLLGQMNQRGVRALQPPLAYLDNYLVFTRGKGLSNLIPMFDKAIADIQQDGTYARLRKRYISE